MESIRGIAGVGKGGMGRGAGLDGFKSGQKCMAILNSSCAKNLTRPTFQERDFHWFDVEMLPRLRR